MYSPALLIRLHSWRRTVFDTLLHVFIRYKREKFSNSEEALKEHTTALTNKGTALGINFKFGGTIASMSSTPSLKDHFLTQLAWKSLPFSTDHKLIHLLTLPLTSERHPERPSPASTLPRRRRPSPFCFLQLYDSNHNNNPPSELTSASVSRTGTPSFVPFNFTTSCAGRRGGESDGRGVCGRRV